MVASERIMVPHRRTQTREDKINDKKTQNEQDTKHTSTASLCNYDIDGRDTHTHTLIRSYRPESNNSIYRGRGEGIKYRKTIYSEISSESNTIRGS